MATDPEAIKRFLAREFPPLRAYKGVAPEKLQKRIKRAIGIEYTHVGHTPKPAQLEGLAYALCQGRAMPLFGMRVGKTKLGLDYARMLRLSGHWDEGKAIVFAGPVGGVDAWEDQAKTESTQRVEGVRSGPGAKERLFKLLEDDKTDMVVLSWSTLQQIFTKVTKAKGAKRATAKLDTKALAKAAAKIGLCILDEIHKVANPQSVRFRIASRLIVNCDWRLGYTGTLVGRDPYKVWAPFYLIDEGELLGPSYSFFKEALAKPLSPSEQKNRHKLPHYKLVPKFDKKGKLKLLESWISSFCMSYELKEIQKLRVTNSTVELKMGKLQRQAYLDLLDKADAARFEDDRAIENFFVRLRQVSAGFIPFTDDDGKPQNYFFPDAAKARWFASFLREYRSAFPMLIFHEFVPTGAMLSRMLKNAGVKHGRIGGGTGREKARAARTAFQAGELDVLVIQSASGSEALELGRADYQLFWDSPVSPITRAQAEARALNRGERELFVDDLVCSPSDQKVLAFVKEGKSILSQLRGSARGFSKLFREGM